MSWIEGWKLLGGFGQLIEGGLIGMGEALGPWLFLIAVIILIAIVVLVLK